MDFQRGNEGMEAGPVSEESSVDCSFGSDLLSSPFAAAAPYMFILFVCGLTFGVHANTHPLL